MRNNWKSALIFMALSFAVTQTEANEAQEDIEVMILGTFHFTGGGSDVVNEDIDDFLSAERQSQIRDLLNRLEQFAPDKIMVELDHEHESEFNQIYNDYREGNHTLSVNERQQLGMRLANRLGHEKLYAIDYSSFLDYRLGIAAAKSLEQTDLLDQHQAQIDRTVAKVESQTGLPLIERLILLNSEIDSGNEFFLTIAQMGSIENLEGAMSVLTWWERNLAMFARTAQYADPGERILVIVGAGHLSILNQLFGNAEGFEVICPVPYLTGKPK